MFLDPNSILAALVAFTVGITFHEFAHAYVAYQMGDTTPLRQGRVTLNPLAHMTLWGTLFIFLLGFGWGKPVQHRIWNPRQRLWVSLAGPLSNLLIAFAVGLLLRFGLVPNVGPAWFNLQSVAFVVVFINVILAVFNMIPLSPLDGSSVVAGLLPDPYGRRLADYNARYPQALIVLFLADLILSRYLIGRSVLWTVLNPIVDALMALFVGR